MSLILYTFPGIATNKLLCTFVYFVCTILNLYVVLASAVLSWSLVCVLRFLCSRRFHVLAPHLFIIVYVRVPGACPALAPRLCIVLLVVPVLCYRSSLLYIHWFSQRYLVLTPCFSVLCCSSLYFAYFCFGVFGIVLS